MIKATTILLDPAIAIEDLQLLLTRAGYLVDETHVPHLFVLKPGSFPPIDQQSTLCAICDQIKELHPSSHPWTAKETACDQDLTHTKHTPSLPALLQRQAG